MIYTSYFANLRNIPSDIVPISICGKAPDWYSGLQYKKLAPKWKFFKVYKETGNEEYYVKHYYKEVLDKLLASDVVYDLYKKSNGKDIVLLCYEKPNEFCHRHLVAKWLRYYHFSCEEWSELTSEQRLYQWRP